MPTWVSGLLGLAQLSAACDGGTAPVLEPPGVAAEAIVPALEPALDPARRFRLSTEREAMDELTQGDASALLAAQGRSLFRSIGFWEIVEADRGASVDRSRFVACGEPFYVSSLFGPLELPVEFTLSRLAYRAAWHQFFCDGRGDSVWIMSVAAATRATPRAVGPPAECYGRQCFGMGWVPQPVPARFPARIFSPEAAAEEVFRRTGARVVAVPQAERRGDPGGQRLDMLVLGYRWRVPVERPVEILRPDGTRDTTSVFYVEPYCDLVRALCPLVARRQQPGSGVLFLLGVDTVTGQTRGDTIRVTPVRPPFLEEFRRR